MCFGKIHDIDEVTNARSVGSVIVVAENAKFLSDSDSSLGQIGNEVLGHTIGEFSDLCRRVCADRIEIAKQNALERCAGIDHVSDYFLTDLLGVTIGRSGLFDRSLLSHGIDIRFAIDST